MNNIGALKLKLKEYYNSGAYFNEINTISKKALQYIQTYRKKGNNKNKLALVLDIDETCISNYADIEAYDFANLPWQINKQLNKINSTAIKPIYKLYEKALKLGVKIFFLTSRPEKLRKITEKTLDSAGYKQYEQLILKNKNDLSSALSYKTTKRAEIEQQGYVIIASIGDQKSDLLGGYTKKVFKLPNPFYYIP